MKRYKRRKSKTVRPEEVRQGMTIYVVNAIDVDMWGDQNYWEPHSLVVANSGMVVGEDQISRFGIKWLCNELGDDAVAFFHTRNACQRHCDQLNRG